MTIQNFKDDKSWQDILATETKDNPPPKKAVEDLAGALQTRMAETKKLKNQATAAIEQMVKQNEKIPDNNKVRVFQEAVESNPIINAAIAAAPKKEFAIYKEEY